MTYTDDLVLCTSADGWSLHAPGSTDEDIASGDAPYLVTGPGEAPTETDYAAARAEIQRRAMEDRQMTPREAYEEDCRRKPTYETGQPRKAWRELGEVEQWTWRRDPTPREYNTHQQED